MNKQKILHMLVGLPRSGKSTIAASLGFPIVEPDAIRRVIHGTHWRAEVETLIWAHAEIMVRSLFQAGHNNVILDAVNHTAKRRAIWNSEDWLVKYIIVGTDAETCIKRAIDTNQEYLIPVIQRMAAQWEPLTGTDN